MNESILIMLSNFKWILFFVHPFFETIFRLNRLCHYKKSLGQSQSFFHLFLRNFQLLLNCFQTNWMTKLGKAEKISLDIPSHVPILSSTDINRRQSINSQSNFSVCSLIFGETFLCIILSEMKMNWKSLSLQWKKNVIKCKFEFLLHFECTIYRLNGRKWNAVEKIANTKK